MPVALNVILCMIPTHAYGQNVCDVQLRNTLTKTVCMDDDDPVNTLFTGNEMEVLRG